MTATLKSATKPFIFGSFPRKKTLEYFTIRSAQWFAHAKVTEPVFP
jgi:hypothetical protein